MMHTYRTAQASAAPVNAAPVNAASVSAAPASAAQKTIAIALAAIACAALWLGCSIPSTAYASPEDSQSADPALTQHLEENEQIAPAGTFAEISSGHIDMGPKMIGGTYELMVRDDTSSSLAQGDTSDAPIWRHLEDVVVRVSDQAVMDIPADDAYSFIHGEKKVWVIPQQEIEGVAWLGWNTQDPALLEVLNGGVKLIYVGHQGEGNFYTFVQAGNFSGPQQLWNSEKNESQPVNVEPNTHTHANWVFTAPGVHLVRVTAQAQLSDGTTVEDTHILRFAVGDSADAKEALAAQWNQQTSPAHPAEVQEPSAIDTFVNLPLLIGLAIVIGACAVCGAVLVRHKRTASAQNQAIEDMRHANEYE